MSEQLFLEPAARRQAMLDIIGAARQRLVLSLFRCDDYGVIDALSAACRRGVVVEAILTNRAKGGRKLLRELSFDLEEMGAVVYRYGDPVVKYHAKYLVADERLALIATLNPTIKCFTRTWDFVLTSRDRTLVRSVAKLFELDASGQRIQASHRLSERLIVGPDGARTSMRHLINSAHERIDVLDHKLSDPQLLSLLRKRRDAGVQVSVIGRQLDSGLSPHGKLMILDGQRAVLGSLAMSERSLDLRREVSVVVDAPEIVRRLSKFYRGLSARAGKLAQLLPGDD